MSQESFYLYKVLDFDVALDNLCDKYNHILYQKVQATSSVNI